MSIERLPSPAALPRALLDAGAKKDLQLTALMTLPQRPFPLGRTQAAAVREWMALSMATRREIGSSHSVDEVKARVTALLKRESGLFLQTDRFSRTMEDPSCVSFAQGALRIDPDRELIEIDGVRVPAARYDTVMQELLPPMARALPHADEPTAITLLALIGDQGARDARCTRNTR